jgi:23S rRNA pseudouridine2605 synthase
VGYLCAASDGHGGRLVTELVRDIPARLVPVGRLDRDSAGLLLMSDDGDLIAKITHPRYGHRKEYLVEVSGECGADELRRLREPMEIDGYQIRPVGVRLIGKAGGLSLLRFVLGEGRNRQIRRMCAMVGLSVVSLTRVAIDGLRLGDLPPGSWRELTPAETEALRGSAKAKPGHGVGDMRMVQR